MKYICWHFRSHLRKTVFIFSFCMRSEQKYLIVQISFAQEEKHFSFFLGFAGQSKHQEMLLQLKREERLQIFQGSLQTFFSQLFVFRKRQNWNGFKFWVTATLLSLQYIWGSTEWEEKPIERPSFSTYQCPHLHFYILIFFLWESLEK